MKTFNALRVLLLATAMIVGSALVFTTAPRPLVAADCPGGPQKCSETTTCVWALWSMICTTTYEYQPEGGGGGGGDDDDECTGEGDLCS